jgi:hypothetical protein
MRGGARRAGKAVPDVAVLEQLTRSMICPDCFTIMVWRQAEDPKRVASIQHYRDGRIAVVCMSCNSRHANMPGDTYQQLPDDHKFCQRCKTVKHKDAFPFASESRGGVHGKYAYCHPCALDRSNQWKREHRDRYNACQRARYAEKKARNANKSC